MQIFIVICLILIIGCLVAEKMLATRHRFALSHVIHVNGTRGKSAVTRLIAAGIAESGIKTYCKTTGTLPMTIDTKGEEREIKRLGKANISEQIKTLKAAVNDGAEILVIECMAVDPELQYICQEKILKADIGVITNARVDHVAEMGDTEEKVCNCLCGMIPKGGKLFTADSNNFAMMSDRAKELSCEAHLVEVNYSNSKESKTDTNSYNLENLKTDTNSYNLEDLKTEDFNIDDVLFPENIALALSVCEAIGIDKETALRGFSKVQADPYEAAAFSLPAGGTFVNAMSANDPISTKMVYERFKKYKDEKLIIVLNTRSDRGYRTNLMIDVIEDLNPDEVWLTGPGRGIARRKLKKRLSAEKPKDNEVETKYKENIREFKKVGDLPLRDAKDGDMVLAIGNIVGIGFDLMDIVKKGENTCTDK